MKAWPVLFSRNKDNSIQKWSVYTDGPNIYSTFGKVDGKQQTSQKSAVGKNIGRSNETTPEQQAELEARSMWQKKLDEGYQKDISSVPTKLVFLPMLAHELKDKTKLQFPVFVQPKMDGVRCLAFWQNDKIILLSRGGKEYNVEHISKQLENFLPKGHVFDGELYIHGVLRQDIQALVKKHREENYGDTNKRSSDIEYWVYDCFRATNLDEPYALRKTNLYGFLAHTHRKIIRCVYTHEIQTLEQLEKLHKFFNRNGFEGSIIRLPNGKYELAQRSRSLLKYKDFQDAEFIITGFKSGVGKFTDCVIWQCETSSGRKFDVVPKGTLEQKKKWFIDGLKYINKELTVKFQGLSKDGIPEFPVGIALRLEEDR